MRATTSVFLLPLQRQFGWSKPGISVATSINILLFGLMGPFAAALMQRYGLRRVVVSALVTMATAALVGTQIQQLWQLWLLWGVMVGLGSGCMATVLAATVANRWFVERRGLVTGVLSAATATGQLIFLPVLEYLADHVGFRWLGVVVGISALAVIPIVLGFIRNWPGDIGILPFGAPADYSVSTTGGNPVKVAFAGLRMASRVPSFWLLFGSFLVCGLSTNGLIQTHFISAAHDHAIPSGTAAGYLAAIGVFDVIGTLGSGWLTDRVDPRKLLLAYYGLRGVSLILLDQALSSGRIGLLGFFVFYGLDWVATVPPTVALCREMFGIENAGVIYGWVYVGHQIGGALMAWLAGAIHDWTGGYRLAFHIVGIVCVATAIAVMSIKRDHVDTYQVSLASA